MNREAVDARSPRSATYEQHNYVSCALLAQRRWSRMTAAADDRPCREGLRPHLQRQRPDRLGWQSEALVGQGRRHHRPDHRRESDQGKHVPDLDQRHGGRLRAALLLQARAGRQQGLCQLRHPVSQQSGGPGQLGRRRLPGGHGGRADLHRHSLRGAHDPRHHGGARRKGRLGQGWQEAGRRLGRERRRNSGARSRRATGTITSSSPKAITCSISSTASRPWM